MNMNTLFHIGFSVKIVGYCYLMLFFYNTAYQVGILSLRVIFSEIYVTVRLSF